MLWILFLLVKSIGLQAASAIDCSTDTLNECVNKLYSITRSNQSIVFATSEHELDTLCRHVMQSVVCVNDFTEQCFNQEKRKTYQRLTSGVNDLIHSFCYNNSDFRQAYLKHAKCFNELQHVYNVCTNEYTKEQQSLKLLERSKAAIDDQKDKMACCQFSKYSHCMLQSIQAKCGFDAAQLAAKIIVKTGGKSLQVQCAPYRHDKEICKSVFALLGSGTTNPHYNTMFALPYTLSYFLFFITLLKRFC